MANWTNGSRPCRPIGDPNREGYKKMQRALFGILLAVLLLTSACQRIEEPWVREDNPLAQERARTPENQQMLRHRITWVQTDR